MIPRLHLVKDDNSLPPRRRATDNPALRIDEVSPGLELTVQGERSALDLTSAQNFGVPGLTLLLDDVSRSCVALDEGDTVEVDLTVRVRVTLGETPVQTRLRAEKIEVGDLLVLPKALVALDG